MATGRPVLFLGQPGCGKTHLALAILAILAVEAGFALAILAVEAG